MGPRGARRRPGLLAPPPEPLVDPWATKNGFVGHRAYEIDSGSSARSNSHLHSALELDSHVISIVSKRKWKIFFLCKEEILFMTKRKLSFLRKKKIFFLCKRKIFFLHERKIFF